MPKNGYRIYATYRDRGQNNNAPLHGVKRNDLFIVLDFVATHLSTVVLYLSNNSFDTLHVFAVHYSWSVV